MWFAFPPGAESITVELQPFNVEHTDDEGNKYFRAPDHFAPKILALGGFRQVLQPEGAPPDLAPANDANASAMESMAAQLSALKDENVSLRNQLAEAAGMLKDYQDKLTAAQTRIVELTAPADTDAGRKK